MNQTASYPLLNSTDPKQRYQAVKEIARAKDETMLDTLSRLAANDPDEQVRQVAAKAQQYISSGLEGVLPPGRTLTKEDQIRAKEYVDEGLGYQMKGERNKALKALAKAADLNPTLQRDPFFISVLNATTGAEGEEALAMLRDKAHIKKVAVNERQLAREKRLQDHVKDAEKSTWASALIDLAIYTCILIAGTILAVMVLGQSADGVITGYNAAVDAYYDGLESGTPEKDLKYPAPVDPALWAQAEALRAIGLPTALLVGLIAGVSSLVSAVIQLVIIHSVARFMFKGTGTMPHLIYKVVSFYNGRIPILFVLMILGIILTFSGGGQGVATLFSGLIGLFSLFISFKMIGRVAETYDFGMARGCLSVIVASVILGIVGFIVQMLFLASLSSLIMGSFSA